MLPNMDVFALGLGGRDELEAAAEESAGTDNNCDRVILWAGSG